MEPELNSIKKKTVLIFLLLQANFSIYYHPQPLSVLFCIEFGFVKPMEGTSLLKALFNFLSLLSFFPLVGGR